MMKLIEKFQWPLVVAGVCALAVWVVCVPLGATLGVPPGVTGAVQTSLAGAATALATLALALVRKDSDGDGIPDVIDEDVSDA